mmetsp:Transcript_5803/g.18597  ORF Transcript_5803/g.18597 Transcript_5803/m.18597 type:complete len:373 (-) Transcript_5803:2224-3342(-)
MAAMGRRWAPVLLALALLALLATYTEAFFGGGGGRRRAPPPEEVEEIDLYAILGIDEEATDKEIKSAYRKLSMKYHPDRTGGDDDAAEKFREVSAAYEVLSSEEKKFLYDQGGMALLKEAADQENRGGGGMDGFFGGFFGGGGGGRGNRGPDYQMRLRVTLEELYNGVEKEARIPRRVVCRGCEKPKLSDKAKARCAKCGRCPNEVRMVQRQMGGFLVQQQEEVPSKHKCQNEPKVLTAHIERGMSEGEELRFKYMSEQKPKQIPGDVVMVLQQARHMKFERDGNNLRYTMKITLKEALTGFVKTFNHLDGHEVEIDRSNDITKPMQTITLRGEGMPVHEVPSLFGDLYVKFEVVFPVALTPDQIDQIKSIL